MIAAASHNITFIGLIFLSLKDKHKNNGITKKVDAEPIEVAPTAMAACAGCFVVKKHPKNSP